MSDNIGVICINIMLGSVGHEESVRAVFEEGNYLSNMQIGENSPIRGPGGISGGRKRAPWVSPEGSQGSLGGSWRSPVALSEGSWGVRKPFRSRFFGD